MRFSRGEVVFHRLKIRSKTANIAEVNVEKIVGGVKTFSREESDLGTFLVPSPERDSKLDFNKLNLLIFSCFHVIVLDLEFWQVVTVSVSPQWFPRHKGLVNGLIVAGFGLGALGSTTLQTMYLNPENKPPQNDG
ncbi:hypothetical protein E2C01_049015 [Portunus trituberculatus]|uniref:Uncharacterized protein n=1 Tax=Portunus trituberculatus TaxID=210409 RepID=A0A5B7G833_PORTR|nr:hypothetical protein [Portunus trituberculatus]